MLHENNLGDTTHTSVKVKHAPGGQSNLQLGNSQPNPQQQNQGVDLTYQNYPGKTYKQRKYAYLMQQDRLFAEKKQKEAEESNLLKKEQLSENNMGQTSHTSVKVHFQPGGNSSISIGNKENERQEKQPSDGFDHTYSKYPGKTVKQRKFAYLQEQDRLLAQKLQKENESRVKTEMSSQNNMGETLHTSVKVHFQPGGNSQIQIGEDQVQQKQQPSDQFDHTYRKYSGKTVKQRKLKHLQQQDRLNAQKQQKEHETMVKKEMSSENNMGETLHTSVKVHQQPGGNSQIQFGEEQVQQKQQPSDQFDHTYRKYSGKTVKQRKMKHLQQQDRLNAQKQQKEHESMVKKEMSSENNMGETLHTSVKIHQQPGGKSQIQFGEEVQQKQQLNPDKFDHTYSKYPGKTVKQRKFAYLAEQDRILAQKKQREAEKSKVQKVQASENNMGETSHTSVKVHHAPGGTSQIQFGNYEEQQPKQRQQPQKQQKVHEQLGGKRQPRQMVREHNIGETNRTSVKVHHAPGGTSQVQIGGGYGQQQPQKYKKPGKTPGGNSQIQMGGNYGEEQPYKHKKPGKTPGGNSQIQMGGNYGEEQPYKHKKPGKTPGGNSQIQMGGNYGEEQPQKHKKPGKTPGGNSQIQLGGNYGVKQTHTSVKVQQQPGGKSQVHIGDDNLQQPQQFRELTHDSTYSGYPGKTFKQRKMAFFMEQDRQKAQQMQLRNEQNPHVKSPPRKKLIQKEIQHDILGTQPIKFEQGPQQQQHHQQQQEKSQPQTLEHDLTYSQYPGKSFKQRKMAYLNKRDLLAQQQLQQQQSQPQQPQPQPHQYCKTNLQFVNSQLEMVQQQVQHQQQPQQQQKQVDSMYSQYPGKTFKQRKMAYLQEQDRLHAQQKQREHEQRK